MWTTPGHRYEASERGRDEIAEHFLAAARDGHLETLECPLAEHVALHGNGGDSGTDITATLLVRCPR
jgi:hypothetical protein